MLAHIPCPIPGNGPVSKRRYLSGIARDFADHLSTKQPSKSPIKLKMLEQSENTERMMNICAVTDHLLSELSQFTGLDIIPEIVSRKEESQKSRYNAVIGGPKSETLFYPSKYPYDPDFHKQTKGKRDRGLGFLEGVDYVDRMNSELTKQVLEKKKQPKMREVSSKEKESLRLTKPSNWFSDIKKNYRRV